MELTDIDSKIINYVDTWLRSLSDEDDFHRLEELGPDEGDEDKPDLSVLGNLEEALVYSPDWSSPWLLIPHGGWTWNRIPTAGELLAIDQFGRTYSGTVATFAADSRMWVEQGPWLIANNPPSWSDWPFPYAGDAWNGTRSDGAFGETDWIVRINGEEDSFNLETRRIVFSETIHAEPGTYLEIETAGYSMSTGEIGTTVNVDVDGAIFASSWGYMTTCEGHADPGLELERVFEMADPEQLGFTSVTRVTSAFYTRQQMREVVRSIISDSSDEEREEIEVQCSDWSGTAAEFLAED